MPQPLHEDDNPYAANARHSAGESKRSSLFCGQAANSNEVKLKLFNPIYTLRRYYKNNKSEIPVNGEIINEVQKSEYLADLHKAKEILVTIARKHGKNAVAITNLTKDLARAASSEINDFASCPDKAPVLWDERRERHRDPISFALTIYAAYRSRGMSMANLLNVDKPLYKSFCARCYYIKKSPRAVFEIAEVVDRKTKAAHAKHEGIISGVIINCPKQSDIGRTISEAEYRVQLRAYEKQQHKILRRRRSLLQPTAHRGDGASPSKAARARADGVISDPVISCPKKAEIGKTITSLEYRALRRAYESQLQRVRRRERAFRHSPS